MADSTFATMPLARTSGCAHPLETNFTPPIHVSWIPCVDCPGNHDYCLNLVCNDIDRMFDPTVLHDTEWQIFVCACFCCEGAECMFRSYRTLPHAFAIIMHRKKATRSAKRSPRSPHAAYAGGAAALGSSAAGSADSSAAVSSAASSAGSASTGGSASGSAGSAGCSAGVSPVGVPGAGMRAT